MKRTYFYVWFYHKKKKRPPKIHISRDKKSVLIRYLTWFRRGFYLHHYNVCSVQLFPDQKASLFFCPRHFLKEWDILRSEHLTVSMFFATWSGRGVKTLMYSPPISKHFSLRWLWHPPFQWTNLPTLHEKNLLKFHGVSIILTPLPYYGEDILNPRPWVPTFI